MRWRTAASVHYSGVLQSTRGPMFTWYLTFADYETFVPRSTEDSGISCVLLSEIETLGLCARRVLRFFSLLVPNPSAIGFGFVGIVPENAIPSK